MKLETHRIIKKLFLNASAIIGFVLLGIFIVIAIFAPFIAPPKEGRDPYMMPIVTWTSSPQPPSPEHLFGVAGKRDIFYGVIWGTRTAFRVGIIVTVVSTLIGLFVGSIAGYYGKLFDEILMRITDIFMAIPFLVAALVLAAILGSGLNKVMIAMTIFGWMYPARLIRGNILQVKEEQYIMAAKALGVKNYLIIIRHVLPNTIFPVLIQASMRMGSLVITAAALSFLGVGAPQGYSDWGALLNYSRNWMLGGQGEALRYWYSTVFPGAAMVLFVLSWNLVGDALRDVFDPRLRI